MEVKLIIEKWESFLHHYQNSDEAGMKIHDYKNDRGKMISKEEKKKKQTMFWNDHRYTIASRGGQMLGHMPLNTIRV